MAKRAARASRTTHPEPGGGGRGWWQATGTETCSVCAARFDLEVEVRCAACDAPLCPVCAVVVTGTAERVCAGCAETGEAGGKGG